MKERLYICEIIERLEDSKTDRMSIEILKSYKTPALGLVLKYIYDVTYYPILEGVELGEYREDECPIGMANTTLYNEARKLDMFFKRMGSPERKHNEKVLLRMAYQISEGLHKDEARIFRKIILGTFKIKGLGIDVINQVFLDLITVQPEEKEVKADVKKPKRKTKNKKRTTKRKKKKTKEVDERSS